MKLRFLRHKLTRSYPRNWSPLRASKSGTAHLASLSPPGASSQATGDRVVGVRPASLQGGPAAQARGSFEGLGILCARSLATPKCGRETRDLMQNGCGHTHTHARALNAFPYERSAAILVPIPRRRSHADDAVDGEFASRSH